MKLWCLHPHTAGTTLLILIFLGRTSEQKSVVEPFFFVKYETSYSRFCIKKLDDFGDMASYLNALDFDCKSVLIFPIFYSFMCKIFHIRF